MTDDRVWSRRRWLAAAGGATAAALAGCSSSDDSGDGSGSSPGNGASPDGQGTTNSSGPVTADGEWPMELFGASNTASTAASGPNGPVTERWAKELGGSKAGAVVAGDTVYVPVDERGVYAFDLLSGEQLWKHETEALYIWVAATEDQVYVSKSGMDVSPTFTARDPANGDVNWEYDAVSPRHVRVVDGTVYLVVNDGLVALDQEGNRQTKITLPAKPSRPAISDGTVFLKYGAKVGAFDATSGDQRWERDYEGIGYSRGIVADDERLYHLGADRIEARDRSTGELTWTWSEEPRQNIIPMVADGVVYASVAPAKGVVGIDAASGETVSRYEIEVYGSRKSVADGTLYMVGAKPTGSTNWLYALDLEAESVGWKTELPGSGTAEGPPVVLEDLLLVEQGGTFTVFESG